MQYRRSLQWPPLAILAAGLLPVGPMGVLAQFTNATCLPEFSGLDNSRGQSPCLLAAYLQGVCTGGDFNIYALPPGTHYTGPYANENNTCQCSSVTYNVLSACGACQGNMIISWSAWNSNCTTVYPGVFVLGVPEGTAIPQWAFQDVTQSDIFNVSVALSVGDSPESTAIPSQSTFLSLGPPSTSDSATSGSASLTETPTVPSTGSSGSKTNTGAIAGGVVGGVVGAALIAGAIIYLVMGKRRSRSQGSPSAEITGAQPSSPLSSGAFTGITPFPSQMVQPRLYDPSDPSTFPTSPPPISTRTGSSYGGPNTVDYSSASLHPGGHYSGAPEI